MFCGLKSFHGKFLTHAKLPANRNWTGQFGCQFSLTATHYWCSCIIMLSLTFCAPTTMKSGTYRSPKHIEKASSLYGKANDSHDTMDVLCRKWCLYQNVQSRWFHKVPVSLNVISGTERADICKTYSGMIQWLKPRMIHFPPDCPTICPFQHRN